MNDEIFPRDLIELVRRLAGTPWRAPELAPARWACRTERLRDASAVAAALQRFDAEAAGWVETTATAQRWHAGQPWPAGTVLNAELAADRRSLHVREADGEWLCTTWHALEPKTEAEPGPDAPLRGWTLVREHCAVDTGEPWRHEVLLVAEAGGALREVAARLLPPAAR
ncbi:hypothetical protein [Rubrivivax benzoatilyticus]|uniref:Uncharacterized protein n=1 Tax=Rubrivivax benzoatilyticus TaxID=316997 RepID=A0ABX0HWW5_9BURK|nr:hypothetical protein [Rubrivivax benzoatilyticus]EGJ09048.1 hypothetical protein RBXJA2T_01905 [Rubrivivax benzoatilyticus JA2 = ATCC BAA-35]NHK99497.1 hypothetical protein [Rubrivivax benzoatilyticus]NHL25371.1 hypothetical protein [Rubrivivax benzoatilyticus]